MKTRLYAFLSVVLVAACGDVITSNGPHPPMGVLEPVNNCGVDGTVQFEDHTGASDSRVVTFPSDGTPAMYSPPCILIAAGQSVTFTGEFGSHPLEEGATAGSAHNGTGNNPIPSISSGTTSAPIMFPTRGIFPFHCGVHAGMFGAIKVE